MESSGARRTLIIPRNHWIDLDPGDPRECPYLADREIRLELGVVLPDRDFFDELLARGHRRLGQVFYRPGCTGCRSCVPIRVPVDAFAPSKSQRRLWRRVARRYEVHVLPPLYHDEHFELYVRHSMHVAEDNTPGDAESYARAFLTSSVQTHLIEYRSDGQLVGASILDEGSTALSSVYVFWDPDLADLSPGTFSALWELRWAADRGKDHYYLGYWIGDCDRMSYKSRFRPYELYDWQTERWQRHETLSPTEP